MTKANFELHTRFKWQLELEDGTIIVQASTYNVESFKNVRRICLIPKDSKKDKGLEVRIPPDAIPVYFRRVVCDITGTLLRLGFFIGYKIGGKKYTQSRWVL